MLVHKTSPNKFEKTEIVSSNFFNHNGMKLKITYKKKTKTHKQVKAKKLATKQLMGQQ